MTIGKSSSGRWFATTPGSAKWSHFTINGKAASSRTVAGVCDPGRPHRGHLQAPGPTESNALSSRFGRIPARRASEGSLCGHTEPSI